jgi:hypothetical protein
LYSKTLSTAIIKLEEIVRRKNKVAKLSKSDNEYLAIYMIIKRILACVSLLKKKSNLVNDGISKYSNNEFLL